MDKLEKPMGGTEILYNAVSEMLGDELSDFNILLTKFYPDDIRGDKINVMWQHNNLDDQDLIKMMSYKPMMEKIDQYVFVSNYHYEVFKSRFDLPTSRCHVIRNATHRFEDISLDNKSKDKIRLVYSSTPWRGLGLLLQSFELLDRNDVELNVYSGVSIYGRDFADNHRHMFEPLFQRAKNMKNVNYHEYLPNKDLREVLKDCHIMAYPSAFPETSCLAAIEAMAAGCKFVGSTLAALPETTGVYGELVPIGRLQSDENINAFIKRYAEVLDKAIDNYWSDKNQEMLQDQIRHFNRYYSWDYVIDDWRKFLSIARKMGKI